jgi:hypothetical protein
MQIKVEHTTEKIVEIETPHYAKSDSHGYFYKFDEEGVLIAGDNIILWQTKVQHPQHYINSIPCTREEVESKFKEVINNLKNKI